MASALLNGRRSAIMARRPASSTTLPKAALGRRSVIADLPYDLPDAGFKAAPLSGSGATGISLPVTERRISMCLTAARFTSSAVTLAMAAGQSLICSIVWPISRPSP